MVAANGVPARWRDHAVASAARSPAMHQVVEPFLAVVQYIDEVGWEGACHPTAAILHILFDEVGISNVLRAGEARVENIVFDHLWIEAYDAVFDAAVMRTLGGHVSVAPVFRGLDLERGEESPVSYGIVSGEPRGVDAEQLLGTPFHRYMSRYPEHPEGLWGIARVIGAKVGLKLSVRSLKDRYSKTEWVVR